MSHLTPERRLRWPPFHRFAAQYVAPLLAEAAKLGISGAELTAMIEDREARA